MTVEEARELYFGQTRWAQRHNDRRPWEPKKPAGWACVNGHDWDWLKVEMCAIAIDLATAEAHRVTGGPHPRLLGLTDGPALAAEAGVAWA